LVFCEGAQGGGCALNYAKEEKKRCF